MTTQFDSIEDALAAIRQGEMVVVVDDDDRENEGDLIMAVFCVPPSCRTKRPAYTLIPWWGAMMRQ